MTRRPPASRRGQHAARAGAAAITTATLWLESAIAAPFLPPAPGQGPAPRPRRRARTRAGAAGRPVPVSAGDALAAVAGAAGGGSVPVRIAFAAAGGSTATVRVAELARYAWTAVAACHWRPSPGGDWLVITNGAMTCQVPPPRASGRAARRRARTGDRRA